ncbi:methyltransferase domain-containing protein [Ectothiorhodospiraceae bacterium WFHF3C12]|nr:methyltransferase domain-containing protein [Ectothiorhodospiraceae bacterium WFHF3C12]
MTPAEIYESRFVPALFGQWAEVLAETAGIKPGDEVLDVACGTGVAARAASKRAADGRVCGADPNPDMLAVARANAPDIVWHETSAEALPFPDASFDVVVSQFGLMFFDDQIAGLRQMLRVLRPGGRMVVAVCGALDHSPGYAVLVEMLHRLFGHAVAEAFRAPFSLGDTDQLRQLCRDAGLPAWDVERQWGRVRFGSINDLVSTERACAWTLGGLLNEEQFNRLDREAALSLKPFLSSDGRVDFDMPALIVTAVKG